MKETSLARMSNLLHALGDYGMVVMLLLLGLFFSLVTLTEQQPTPEVGARELAQRIKANHNTDSVVWIVNRSGHWLTSRCETGTGSMATARRSHRHHRWQ